MTRFRRLRAPLAAAPTLGVGLALAAAAVLGGPAAGPHALATAAAETHLPSGGTFTLTGHGYGHGHGMSQYGAYGAALKGLSAAQILAFYYPGTATTAGGNPTLRVKLSTGTPGAVTVANPARDGALTVTDHAGAGRSLALPASVSGAAVTAWRAVPAGSGLALQGFWSGAWQAYPGWTTAGALSFASATGVVALQTADGGQRDYRGAVEAVPSGGSVLALNLVPRESYLRSVVPSEMPSSWSAAALQAQTVAARTYAAAVSKPTAASDICDTSACQMYSGVAAYSAAGALVRRYEVASTDAAVSATAGQLRTLGGAPILAQFSSSDGGWTAAGGEAYLPAEADPYDGVVSSTAHSWTQTVTAAAAGAAAGVGTATEIVVDGRDGNGDWGGRTTSVTVVGTTGTATLSAATFAGRLGLRSVWWTAPAGSAVLGGRDLYDVVPRGGSGQVEVHALSAPAYQSFLAHDATALGAVAVPADWAFLTGSYAGDGQPDLYAVHLRGTASGRVEVHVLTAASHYRTYAAHVATAQPALPTGPAYDLSLASYAGDGRPDLALVQSTATGSGRVEVHVLSAASGFQTFLTHAATAMPTVAAGQWTFLLGDAAGRGDLVGVHHGGTTGSGRTEVHVLSEASGYQAYTAHVATPSQLFPAGTTEWALAGATDPGQPADLVLLVPGSGSGHLDLHVLSGASGWSAWSAHVATALAAEPVAAVQASIG